MGEPAPNGEKDAAPCGHPLALYEHTDGTMRPVVVTEINQGGVLGVIPPAVWCNHGCGWVETDASPLGRQVSGDG